MRVALVAHQPDVTLFADGEDALVLIGRNYAAGRIVWRTQNYHAGLGIDGSLDHTSFHAEAVFGTCLHVNWRATGILDDVGVADPIRGGNDDFIALLYEDADDVEDRVLSADVDDTFLWLVVGFQFTLVPGADGFAEGHDPAGGGVLGEILLDGTNSGFLDVLGGREVGFAGAKVGNVHTFSLQLFCFGDHGGGWRDLDAVDAFRPLHCVLL